MARALLVVDGYNVIRSCSRYRALIDEDAAGPVLHDVYVRSRKALLADVAAFALGAYDAAVVFDAFGNGESERPPMRTAGVDVVFSPTGVEADAVIERMVTAAREEGRPVTVITSDAVVQSTVFGDGVTRLSARMFDDEAQAINEHIAERHQAPQYPLRVRSTVEDRVPPDVRERLRQMTLPKRKGLPAGNAGRHEG